MDREKTNWFLYKISQIQRHLNALTMTLKQGCSDVLDTAPVVSALPQNLPESPLPPAIDGLPQDGEFSPEIDSVQPPQSTPSVQPSRYQGMEQHESSIAAGRLKRLARDIEVKSSRTIDSTFTLPVIKKQGISESNI
jgi:hypothetical protein